MPQLLVYARLEGVEPLVHQALALFGADCRLPADTQSLLPDGYAVPRPSATADLATLVSQVREEAASHSLSLLRLVETDRLLRRLDTDEAALMQQLRTDHNDAFFASLLQLLAEQTGLTEGFMPCPPQDNHTTKLLRTTLTNHLSLC